MSHLRETFTSVVDAGGCVSEYATLTPRQSRRRGLVNLITLLSVSSVRRELCAALFLQQKRAKAMKEGWEYAPLGSSSFHITEGRLDFARRRRYVRKLVNEKPGARAVFRFTGKKDKKKKKKKDDDDSDDEEKKQQVPRMYVDFKGEPLQLQYISAA